MSDRLAAALSLAKLGWHVFPVRSDSTKRPLVLWGSEASTDTETIATWWGQHPDALVGVHAGMSHLHIVDVDEKDGKSGSANLAAAGIELPKTLTYLTPSGGSHHVYAAPDHVQLTIAQNYPVDAVDIRAGNGYVVYYGPPITKAPKLAAAPESTLKRKADQSPPTATATGSAPAAASATIDEWIARTPIGKRSKAVKAAQRAVTSEGMARADMLQAVADLVKLGAEPGAGDAYEAARTTYLANYPDHARSWDKAAEGSVKRFGLPPVTIPLTKTEKKQLARRREQKTKSVTKPGEKRPHTPGQPPADGTRILEDGPLAVELADLFAAKWAWTEQHLLLRYDGRVWSPAPAQALVEAVRQELEQIEVGEHMAAVQRKDKLGITKALSLLSRNRARAVAELVTGILAERTVEADGDPDLLNVQNGVVDLRTGELRPHDSVLMFTKITAVDYDPDAVSADWEKALGAMPPRVAAWMQVRFGQAITGRIPEDAVVPFLRGGGDNGKSAILNGVRGCLGTYAVTVPDRLLLASVGDHPTELMTLMGTRIAITEELPDNHHLNTKRLKDIAGTPVITARRMRQDFVSFPATHSLFISTNPLPIVSETDHGTWRRLMLVTFPYRFRKPGKKLRGNFDKRGDPGLRDRLGDSPSPAILTWLVQGAVAWYANDMSIPDAPTEVRRDTRKWRHDADPVMQFTDERLELAKGSVIWVMDMLREFNEWQDSQGTQKWSSRTISSRFEGHESLPGVTKKYIRFSARHSVSRPLFTIKRLGSGAECWIGVKFKTPDEPSVPVSAEGKSYEELVERLGQ
jgi:putative DNA primase/helicase